MGMFHGGDYRRDTSSVKPSGEELEKLGHVSPTSPSRPCLAASRSRPRSARGRVSRRHSDELDGRGLAAVLAAESDLDIGTRLAAGCPSPVAPGLERQRGYESSQLENPPSGKNRRKGGATTKVGFSFASMMLLKPLAQRKLLCTLCKRKLFGPFSLRKPALVAYFAGVQLF
jgi:hypothetical protein